MSAGMRTSDLSGGQAKMVAIGRALALQPDLLILDEPLEGLAPVVVENLKRHIRAIHERGIAVLIAESNVTLVPEGVDRLCVIERGDIVASGDRERSGGRGSRTRRGVRPERARRRGCRTRSRRSSPS